MRVTPCRTTLRRAEVEACNDGLLRNFFFVSPTHVTWRFFLFMLSNTGSAPAARSHTTHTHKRAPASGRVPRHQVWPYARVPNRANSRGLRPTPPCTSRSRTASAWWRRVVGRRLCPRFARAPAATHHNPPAHNTVFQHPSHHASPQHRAPCPPRSRGARSSPFAYRNLRSAKRRTPNTEHRIQKLFVWSAVNYLTAPARTYGILGVLDKHSSEE